jgi:hypothetical protein
MAQPTASSLHIDSALTNLTTAFIQNANNFVAQRVFPIVPVDKKSDKYFTFSQNDFMRSEMQRRAPATESAGMGYTVSNDSYSADVFALHHDVPDEVRQNADSPLSPDRNATQLLTQQALLKLEIQWATDYFGTSIWGTDSTPGTLWDVATSDPIKDVRTGRRVILSNTGFLPNTLVLGFNVMDALVQHPDIVDRVKYTSAQNVTTDILARLFEVDRVLVAQAVKATNVEGATAAYDFTHGKHALLCYANPTPALEMPSAGYTFEWRGISQGLGAGVAVSRFRMEHLKADRIEIESAWDNKVVSSSLGYFFSSAVS